MQASTHLQASGSNQKFYSSSNLEELNKQIFNMQEMRNSDNLRPSNGRSLRAIASITDENGKQVIGQLVFEQNQVIKLLNY